MYNIHINPELRARIDARASELGISTAAYIKLAVSEKLEEETRP
jgi:predicted DNA-binding protein